MMNLNLRDLENALRVAGHLYGTEACVTFGNYWFRLSGEHLREVKELNDPDNPKAVNLEDALWNIQHPWGTVEVELLDWGETRWLKTTRKGLKVWITNDWDWEDTWEVCIEGTNLPEVPIWNFGNQRDLAKIVWEMVGRDQLEEAKVFYIWWLTDDDPDAHWTSNHDGTFTWSHSATGEMGTLEYKEFLKVLQMGLDVYSPDGEQKYRLTPEMAMKYTKDEDGVFKNLAFAIPSMVRNAQMEWRFWFEMYGFNQVKPTPVTEKDDGVEDAGCPMKCGLHCGNPNSPCFGQFCGEQNCLNL